MRRIELTKDTYALVDDEDYSLVSKYKWQAFWDGFHWYAVTGPNKRTKGMQLNMHRLIMNAQPDQEVDHKKHYVDYIDNQRSNLRLCSHAQNSYNLRKWSKPTSSQYKGVFWNKQCQKWQVQIQPNRGHIHLGLFTDETEAAKVYNTAAIKYFGGFAKLNDVRGEL